MTTVEDRARNFITELITLYNKTGISISHEDESGSFILANNCTENQKWIQESLVEISNTGYFFPETILTWLESLPTDLSDTVAHLLYHAAHNDYKNAFHASMNILRRIHNYDQKCCNGNN